jgi:ectoine hydroxylase-related dioxygenase (phytanoyl-CoA dioxygenase family)
MCGTPPPRNRSMMDAYAAPPVAVERTSELARAFFRGGAVHVRGAVRANDAAAIRAAAHSVLRGWEALAARGALPPELATPYQRQYVPLELLATPRPVAEIILHPAVLALARAYLEKEPEVDANSYVRAIRVSRGDAHLPFHQDQTILQRRLVNVWIALDACGEDAPGLEIVHGSWSRLLEPSPPPQPRFAVERAQLDDSAVVGAFGAGALWRPVFEPGDAMLFSGATVHRTHCTPAMRADRMSVELRLF